MSLLYSKNILFYTRSGTGVPMKDCLTICDLDYENLPETLYCRLIVTTPYASALTDYYCELHQVALALIENDCGCAIPSRAVAYASRLFTFTEDGASAVDDACCMSVYLDGICNSGTGLYTWVLRLNSPFYDGQPDPASDSFPSRDCTLFEGTYGTQALIWQHLGGGDCFQGSGAGSVRMTAEITQSAPGGAAAVECDRACCPDVPDTIYATITAPNCPVMDGAVVTLRYSHSGLRQSTTLTAPIRNPYGSYGTVWYGWMNLCDCETHLRITVTQYTWSGYTGNPAGGPSCAWAISVKANTQECYSMQMREDDDSMCLPVTFDSPDGVGTNDNCILCCTDGDNSAISIEVTQ